MQHLFDWGGPARRRGTTLGILTVVGICSLVAQAVVAAEEHSYGPRGARTALVMPEAWEKAEKTPLRPGEIDQLIARQLQSDKITPAPSTRSLSTRSALGIERRLLN